MGLLWSSSQKVCFGALGPGFDFQVSNEIFLLRMVPSDKPIINKPIQ